MTVMQSNRPDFCSKAQYARLNGWSASYVSYLIDRNVIVTVRSSGVHPLVDVRESDVRYDAMIRPRVRLRDLERDGPELG